ncbi:lipocalin-like domain-containing protein [Paraburkholderia rhizosphaerae]|uniref:Putative secreted hydrolase n=1 Tax=Paraburkholderia rhizosphaerae TaxID=480658 RepID=A0A4R8M2M7_9BURK|nr:carotenoid 1,2-hydratase [Paraburkholderia rhizosphaerae]TDY53953.1 putative secreted hydrolase [Paraburkholderia rhizosphaerae]
MKRRSFLALPRALASLLPLMPLAPLLSLMRPLRAQAKPPDYPPVAPGRALDFPRDFGSHPQYRTEWWYATGWLFTASNTALGFQVTFFRSRPELDDANPSRFAPRQLLFANVAISDPQAGRLQHDQRSARTGFGLAQASETDTSVQIGAWSLTRDAHDGRYQVDIGAADFAMAFAMQPTQPVLLNGAQGYSRKGPLASEASYYYSQPALRVTGMLTRNRASGGKPEPVHGIAWLDHEWSSAYLADDAVGWDWIGINFDDGSALMAFQIRDKAGRKFWAGGTLRRDDDSTQEFAPDDVVFTPLRWWQSPHTNARYPVAMRVDAGDLRLTLTPLFDDQEVDSRASTGAVYWEGAVTVTQTRHDAARADQVATPVARGYLELTGYVARLEL